MKMIKKIILIMLFSILTPSLTHASLITVLTSDAELIPGHPNQGYFGNDIANPFPVNHAFDDTYSVLWVGGIKYRDYFSFFIPAVTGDIASATLQLQRGGTVIEGAGAVYHLGSVATDALTLSQNKGARNLALYDALGAGAAYGDFPISDPTIPRDIFGNYNDILEVLSKVVVCGELEKGVSFQFGKQKHA